MVKIVSNNDFICEICHKKFKNITEAKKHESEHDIVYVPIERADLKALIAFIESGEYRLLTQSLLEVLTKYSTIKSE